jgi:chloramphenicol-sensitive protein RarD
LGDRLRGAGLQLKDRQGIYYATACYTTWGFVPVFWKLLLAVPHLEILAHRMIWTAVFFLCLTRLRLGRGPRAIWRQAKPSWRALLLSAALISVNWGTYIHAVNSGRVLEASLGYFINPLVNVFLGWAILRERLNLRQWISVMLAAAGVLELALGSDRFPALALVLAITFGLYGLVRKRMPLEPLLASTVEAGLLVPVALGYLSFLLASRELAHPPREWLLLIAGGVVTALPLLWFAEAAKRLKLSTLGFFQYLSPSIQFALAVSYGEPFTAVHAKAFACIWTALAIFCVDLAWGARIPRPA